MNASLDTIFSLWFNADQTARVNSHVEENFEIIQYSRNNLLASAVYEGKLNRITREVMWDDSPSTVRVKCFIILIGNPVHMIGRFGFQLVKGVLLVICSLCDLGVLRSTIEEVLRVPYCCIGIELAALIGVFYEPLKGQERVGLLEKKLNSGASLGDAGTYFLAKGCQPLIENIDTDPVYRSWSQPITKQVSEENSSSS